MVLPVLLLVLAMGVWVLAGVLAQVRCTDAAALAARAAARGDAPADVTRTAQSAAPRGATVRVVEDAGTVRVEVSAEVRPFAGLLSALPAIEVSGSAVAAREDAVAGP